MRTRQNAISSRKPRIVIADDSTLAREGLAAIIRRHSRYILCGLALNEEETMQLLEMHGPDLLLIEPFLGNKDGIFLLKQIAACFPKTRILVISKQPEEVYAERALRAGASGYWMKTAKSDELLHAIESVLAGELYVSATVAIRAVHEVVEHPTPPPDEHQQAALAVEVLLVDLHVLGEMADALREQRDLHFGRPCVGVVQTVVADRCGLVGHARVCASTGIGTTEHATTEGSRRRLARSFAAPPDSLSTPL